MSIDTIIQKKKPEDRTIKTNCYVCGDELSLDEVKRNPESKGDDLVYCLKDWKKRFGKKKRLLKRY